MPIERQEMKLREGGGGRDVVFQTTAWGRQGEVINGESGGRGEELITKKINDGPIKQLGHRCPGQLGGLEENPTKQENSERSLVFICPN